VEEIKDTPMDALAVDALAAFEDAKKSAEQAKAALATRYQEIQVEKREILARLNAEAKKIRAVIGRPGRVAAVKPAKAAKKGRKGSGKASETKTAGGAAEAPSSK
jgi:hypothetical protein